MTHGVRRAPVGTQELLRKVVPQPGNYRAKDGRQVTRRGLQWQLNPHDYFQWHQYYGFSDEVLETLLLLAADCEVVIDVGANIGFYSVVVARAHDRCLVAAFEPNPHTFERLGYHQQCNHVEKLSY